MIGRAYKVLSRFPAHYEATRPGKQFEVVADSLAGVLDAESADMARIRRAHRLSDADELRDLLLIAAIHGIARVELGILFTRWTQAQAALQALRDAASDADRDAAAETLCDLWGLDEPPPRLPLFAPDQPGAPDLSAAKTRLIASAQAALSTTNLLDAVRARIASISSIHARGNGTIRAVLEGAANALDLDIGEIHHSDDRFWHAAVAHDRVSLTRPVTVPATPSKPAREVPQAIDPAREVIGLEENPLERNTTNPTGRYHAELFSVARTGFERALLQVRITGKGNLTVGPMIVNRDEGHGLGYALAIPDGKTLVFNEDGRALLEESDVTPFAYAWKGACFAGSDDDESSAFVFDGPGVDSPRPAKFAVAFPAGALDSEFVFPTAGDSLPVPGIAVGVTRFAFFVQEAHYSYLQKNPEKLFLVPPRPAVGFLDNSVFAAQPGEQPPTSAIVSLSWLEHKAFTVRVIIPRRFRDLTPDDPEAEEIRQRVQQALKRFRPAGIELLVEFLDDRWVLGQGMLLSGEAQDPVAELQSGTVLWS